MSSPEVPLSLYLHLARAGQMRNQPLEVDKLLVLAGVNAAEMGLGQIAAFCRLRVLQHLVRRWPTLDHALLDEEFSAYLKQLFRKFPLEKCEHMLASLGIDRSRERETYFSEFDYAAGLLSTSPEELETLFDQDFNLCDPELLATVDAVVPTGSSSPSARAERPALWRWFAAAAVVILTAVVIVWWWRFR